MTIRAVILDWAGTTIDFGSYAPIQSLIDAFKYHDLTICADDARKDMGKLKIDHIRCILNLPHVRAQMIHGDTEALVTALNHTFETLLFQRLHVFAKPLEGVVHTVSALRDMHIKIGSTTGYTRAMMSIVAPIAAQNGYAPDVIVTPDDTGVGRPFPWMIYRNMERLGVFPPHAVVKVGDTLVDMQEGRNAGVWTVGVLHGSNILGLSEREYAEVSPQFVRAKKDEAKQALYAAGAHIVIDRFEELLQAVYTCEKWNARGEKVTFDPNCTAEAGEQHG
ncbi:MAG: phosphonoacetaldehyde hydrolase [Bacilli bacterium]